MMNAMELSARMNLNKCLKLSLVAEMNGALALVERERCHVLSAIHHCRITVGTESSFAITATGGLSCNQIVYYTTRTLKTFFEDMSRDTDPYFKLAVYVSMGMKYKF